MARFFVSIRQIFRKYVFRILEYFIVLNDEMMIVTISITELQLCKKHNLSNSFFNVKSTTG